MIHSILIRQQQQQQRQQGVTPTVHCKRETTKIRTFGMKLTTTKIV